MGPGGRIEKRWGKLAKLTGVPRDAGAWGLLKGVVAVLEAEDVED